MKTNQLVLQKDSSTAAIRSYFEFVSTQNDQNSDSFPIDLNTVWPLAYPRKDHAVRALVNSGFFIENVDYKTFPTFGEAGKHNKTIINEYFLTIPTFEWFVAKRVPAVFDVYRQVFHAVRKQAAQVQLPAVNAELLHRVGAPLVVDGKHYWPYRRVLQTLGYKRPGSSFYRKAALNNVMQDLQENKQLELFKPERRDDYIVQYGKWYCSERAFLMQRSEKKAWDRYQIEKSPSIY